MGKWLPAENDLVNEQNGFRNRIWSETGNAYVSGFPGSGKSVCLLYAVKTIRDKNPDAKILFVEFTHALIKMMEAALKELHLEDIRVVTYKEFRQSCIGPYDYIVCDEVQDFSAPLLKLINKRAHRVIVGGDPNQSIYPDIPGPNNEKEVTVGPEEMKSILHPSTTELTIIHRLNKYVIRAINSFMPDMKMLAEKSSILKKHKPAYIWHCLDQRDEIKRIADDAKATLNFGDSVAVLLPNHKSIANFINLYLENEGDATFDFEGNKYYQGYDYGKLHDYLASVGVKMQVITNGFGSLVTDTDKIIISTYHSSKGLDFDKVFMPFCNFGTGYSDPRIFMVAMSRSRKDLILSYTTSMNDFIRKFYETKEACQFMDFKDMAQGPSLFKNTDESSDDDW